MNQQSILRALAILVGFFACGVANAQDDYPSRPVRIVVPWAAAGVTDVVGRIVGDKLTQVLGQPFVIENKPGANGAIGTKFVAESAPDGYTLLLVTFSTHSVAPALYRKLPFDPIKDFAPISQLISQPLIAVTSAKSSYITLADVASAARAKPNVLNYATFGDASSSNLAAVLFMQAAKIKMTAIPYKGAAPAIAGLMSGDTDLFFDSIPSSLPHAKTGKLRALAVTSQQRVPAAPDIPTLAETYPDLFFNGWLGVEAPAGTPAPVVGKLHAAIVKVMALPDINDRLLQLGGIPYSSGTPEDFGNHIMREKIKIEGLARRAGIPYVD